MQAILNVSHLRSKASRKPRIVHWLITRKSRKSDCASGFFAYTLNVFYYAKTYAHAVSCA